MGHPFVLDRSCGIFLLNVLALAWLATLELVERRRLNKEIKQCRLALWRYLIDACSSATVSWGGALEDGSGEGHRPRSIHRPTAIHPLLCAI